jgi:ribonuclease BN (tRNA processing enzyme)
VLYDTKGIMTDLGITQIDFREICVLSGTDYNIHIDIDEKINDNTLNKTLSLFRKYHKTLESGIGFYNWLKKEGKYNNNDYELLTNIYNMFDLSNHYGDLKVFDKIKIVNGKMMSEQMQPILIEDGFLFPPIK